MSITLTGIAAMLATSATILVAALIVYHFVMLVYDAVRAIRRINGRNN